MDQLPLQIVARRAYSDRNFYRHAGVTDVLLQVGSYLRLDVFRLAYISGVERTGVTHCSIALAAALSEQGQYPHLIEGRDFFDWAIQRQSELRVEADEVVIVDDADGYLKHIARGDSGHFVSIVEFLRKASAALVLMGHTRVHDLGCDAHVMSRLISGQQLIIGHPAERDMAALIAQMAAQRGVNLNKRNLDYLAKRLPHEIQGIDDYLERARQIADVSGKGFRLPVLSDAIPKS